MLTATPITFASWLNHFVLICVRTFNINFGDEL
jgi:hypothetical protein